MYNNEQNTLARDHQGIKRLEQYCTQSRHTDIYRALCPTTEERKFLSRVETFWGIDHIIGNKTSLNTLEITEITHSMLFDHNKVKLKISNKKILGKSTNIWK